MAEEGDTQREVLRVVPVELKQLIKLVASAFYPQEQIVILNALMRHPCVKEEDLIDVLCFDARQVRQNLNDLKKDKLIKSVQKTETVDGRVYRHSYHYINYELFVHVVKYKLDQMRKKIGAEERQVQSRASYTCPACMSTYSELEVDKLFDPTEGALRCSHCGTKLEEELANVAPALQSKLPRLNQQVSRIVELLKIVDKMTLDEALIDPDPTVTATNLGTRKKDVANRHGSGKGKKWTTTRGTDLYGDHAGVTVNFGDDDSDQTKVAARQHPEWLAHSTVFQEVEEEEEEGKAPASRLLSPPQEQPTVEAGHRIMADLIMHEREEDEYSDSSNSEDEPGPSGVGGEEDESSEEEEYTLTIGSDTYTLQEVVTRPDLVARMTPDEKAAYTELYREAYEELHT